MYPTSRGAGELGSWGAGELGSWGAGELGSWGAGELGSWGAGERIDSNSLISLYTRRFLQKRDAPYALRTQRRVKISLSSTPDAPAPSPYFRFFAAGAYRISD